MTDEIIEYIEKRVDEENEYVREEFGVRYFFSSDWFIEDWMKAIPENLLVKYELDREEPYYTSNKDAIKALILHFIKWANDTDAFSWDNIEKKIQKRRDEDARDARTQAAEMGYHDYYGGSYHQSEYVDSLWSRYY